jgi:predicted  nucleic acid-binding Zn-ribbon protein
MVSKTAEQEAYLAGVEAAAHQINELRAEIERLQAKEVELREELVRLRGEIWDLTHPSA